MTIPSTMQAVVLSDYSGASALRIDCVPIPTPKPGEVLVKMAAAPINPSDLVFLSGQYGITKPLPVIAGFEGSGTVVATGGGLYARWLMGKNVACHAPEDGHGTWAEYLVAPASACIPLLRTISLEQGATLLVNPMTAYLLIDQVRQYGGSAFVQTAAASAVGRMIVRLAPRFALTGIHIVRRPEQVKLLKDMGAAYVFDSNDSLFAERLGEACYKFKVTVGLDAVGDELTKHLARAMPAGGRVIVYGSLSGEDCKLGPADLIFGGEKVGGFWLTQWVKEKSLLQKLRVARKVQSLLPTDLQSTIQGRFPLGQFKEAMDLYKRKRTDGKVLLEPK